MSASLLALNIIPRVSIKKQATLTLATVAVILTLPLVAVVSMGPDVLMFLSTTANAKSAETKGFYMGGPVEGDSYAWGNCTYWSYAMRLWADSPIPTSWGNANTWDDRASAGGYIVNHSPATGAVFQTDSGPFGHVGVVTAVDSSTGSWTISEMNFVGLNIVSHRTFDMSSAAHYNFIHGKIGDNNWNPSISLPPA